jgi:hypothetical protein
MRCAVNTYFHPTNKIAKVFLRGLFNEKTNMCVAVRPRACELPHFDTDGRRPSDVSIPAWKHCRVSYTIDWGFTAHSSNYGIYALWRPCSDDSRNNT